MSDITCIKVNAGAIPASSGYPGDFEFFSKAGGAAVLAFRALLSGGIALGVADALTATAGSSQTNAKPLSPGGQPIARVGTVTSGADSVLLPSAIAGAVLLVYNNGGNSMNVYPAGTDQIAAGGAGVTAAQADGTKVLYVCFVAGNWVKCTFS